MAGRAETLAQDSNSAEILNLLIGKLAKHWQM
jgi:hypothetical protein